VKPAVSPYRYSVLRFSDRIRDKAGHQEHASLMLMGCLAPQGTPAFARPEYGFYLREADAWDRLCRAAGFSNTKVEDRIFEQRRADCTPH
jgi:hypothetical protein